MGGKEMINHDASSEMPFMEQLCKNSAWQTSKRTVKKCKEWAKTLVDAVVCLAVSLSVVITFPQLSGCSLSETKITSDGTSGIKNSSVYSNIPVDSEMCGLPVDNFNLADVENGGTMSRIGFLSFGTLFRYGINCFAVVKVTGIQTLEAEYITEHMNKYGEEFDMEREVTPKRQISDVNVLLNIYGECEMETLQITQYVYEDHFCLGTTNLLREGGAYLLPLRQTEGEWYLMGDMDVLFEIDDVGRVWSHSDFEDFNRYDGEDIEILVGELMNMIQNDDFMLANSPFSNTLRSWTLADITIRDKSDIKTDENTGFSYISLSFTLNEILSDPNHSDSAPLGDSGNIKVYADESDKINLLPENRYLLCLDRFRDDIYVNSRMIAKVESDGTITAIPAPDEGSYVGGSIFTPYNGCTISDFREMVSRIDLWRNANE